MALDSKELRQKLTRRISKAQFVEIAKFKIKHGFLSEMSRFERNIIMLKFGWYLSDFGLWENLIFDLTTRLLSSSGWRDDESRRHA